MAKKEIIRTIYLYLFSTIGLLLMVIGSVSLVDLGLKNYFFKKADQPIFYPEPPWPVTPMSGENQEKIKADYQKQQLAVELQQRQAENARRASNAIAMIIVGLPLFFFHWNLLQHENHPA